MQVSTQQRFHSAAAVAKLAARAIFSVKHESRQDSLRKFADSMKEWGEYRLKAGDAPRAKSCFSCAAAAYRALARRYTEKGDHAHSYDGWMAACGAAKRTGKPADYEYGEAKYHLASYFAKKGNTTFAAGEMTLAYEHFAKSGMWIRSMIAGGEAVALLYRAGMISKAEKLSKEVSMIAPAKITASQTSDFGMHYG